MDEEYLGVDPGGSVQDGDLPDVGPDIVDGAGDGAQVSLHLDGEGGEVMTGDDAGLLHFLSGRGDYPVS